MTRREKLHDNPRRHNFYALLREFDRTYRDKPRIGTNLVIKDQIIEIGQDPFLEFPGSNIAKFAEPDGKPPSLRVRFMGLFGPQGALPINTTAEVLEWVNRRNDSFVRFADVFSGRFYQLIYRAWSSARRIAQFDRPEDNRAQKHTAALAGIPVAPDSFTPIDSLPEMARLPVAGLLGGRVRSATKLRQILRQVMRADIEIEEFVPIWVNFESDDRSSLGVGGSTLGADLKLGSRVQTVSDKLRVLVRANSVEDYKSYLPGATKFQLLCDLAQGYLGPFVDIEIAPSMPRNALPAVRIGQSRALGHTSWIAPPEVKGAAAKTFVQSAVFGAPGLHEDEEQNAA